MYAPRTVKTLTVLFLAMTLGTLVLWSMDVDPIRPPGTHLAAVAAAEENPLAVIARTDRPLSSKWNRIVIHGSSEGPAVAGKCHFVVEAPATGGSPLGVRAGSVWLAQEESAHVPGAGHEWNKGAIGVCIQGDFSSAPPSEEQWQSLLKLVTDLQQRFRIPPSRVYLYRSIAARSDSPGAAFPEREFNDSLVSVR
jgi:hypothetical protein